MTQSQPIAHDDEAELLRARKLLEAGQLEAAQAICQTILRRQPDHRDALYMLGVAQRLGGQGVQALATITRLTETDPSYGRGWQEKGHALVGLGRNEEAVAAYQRAVTHNGALMASWKRLAELHHAAGRANAARFAEGQYEHFAGLPPELLTVASLLQEGKLGRAEQFCRAFLQSHGHHVEAMRLLAEIGIRFNALDEAEFLLESCKVLEPENVSAHYDYVKVLRRRQKFEKSLAEARDLLAREPENPEFEMLYANENLGVGNFDEALAIYEKLLVAMPDNPGVNLTYGHALKTVGRQDDAIKSYRRSYASRPDYGDAYWSLANLKTYRFTETEIDQMRERQAMATTALEDRYHLCFALGKALEDRGEIADSFAYYELGNRLKREELGYDWRRLKADMQLQIDHCGPALFEHHSGSGHEAGDPIFIVGLPRAGSTLLEQILASHSQVEGTMELPNVLALAHQLDGRRKVGEAPEYPANLASQSRDALQAFGEAYIKDTQIYRKAGTPFFIDKMPNNFRHVGLIHLILPNARIIDARRGAMGCCFSGFKQLFAEGQDFTYGLEEVGHYYSDYVRLMDHWDQVLPGRVLRVRYEEVVADLESQVRRLLDFCGLPFEEACLNFHETERAVRTASSEQVRQPIFKSGVDQWEKFSEFLDPLRAVLGPELAQT